MEDSRVQAPRAAKPRTARVIGMSLLTSFTRGQRDSDSGWKASAAGIVARSCSSPGHGRFGGLLHLHQVHVMHHATVGADLPFLAKKSLIGVFIMRHHLGVVSSVPAP